VQTNLAWAYFNNEQFKEAHTANDEARAIWHAQGNLPMVADSYTIKLHMYRNTGELDALLALEHEALGASRVIKNVLHEGLALFNICDAYCSQGRFSQAVAALEAARTLAAAASEIPNADIGVFLYSIRIFLSAGALEKADLWADKLYALKEVYQPLTRTTFLVAVAQARIALGRLQEAEDILRSDLDILDQDRPALINMAPVFVADAHLQLAMGHPERALERTTAVIQRLHRAGSRNYLAEAHWLRGRAWLALGEKFRARETLREALAAAQVTSERPILWQILQALSDVERESGNPNEADRLRDQAREVVLDIAANAGKLEDVFIAQPGVSKLLAGA
jgi:tetratricopeptide (TPR) repeat protein